jgi:hypothetical protein
MAPGSTAALTENFQALYPDQMASLPSLRFIEQYDPEDITLKGQPYAYVCDQVHEVQLSVDIDEVRGKGVANDAWSALADLRDKIAPGEKVGWFVVVNGDVERWAPPIEDTVSGSADGSQVSPVSQRSSVGRAEEEYDSDQVGRNLHPRHIRQLTLSRHNVNSPEASKSGSVGRLGGRRVRKISEATWQFGLSHFHHHHFLSRGMA